MIANLLPTEATHNSLDLFERPSLLVTSEGSFCQTLGPVYNLNGPLLEFEVAGDRNNFIDLHKIILEVKCKILQSSGANLKYDGTAAAYVTKNDAPYFCNNALHSLFSKYQMQMEIMLTNVLLRLSFHATRTQKHIVGLSSYDYERALVRQSNDCKLYGKLHFFRHLMSGVITRAAFRGSIDDFVITSDDAAKPYKMKIF